MRRVSYACLTDYYSWIVTSEAKIMKLSSVAVLEHRGDQYSTRIIATDIRHTQAKTKQMAGNNKPTTRLH